jgi:hypothetical protein
VGALRRQPTVHQTVTHGVREGVVQIERARVSRVFRAGVDQVL